MFNISNSDLNKFLQDEIKKHIEKMDLDLLMIDMKELCRLLSLSRPSVNAIFLSDPNFPMVKVGKKKLFNRKAVEAYIDNWSKNNKAVDYDEENLG